MFTLNEIISDFGHRLEEYTHEADWGKVIVNEEITIELNKEGPELTK